MNNPTLDKILFTEYTSWNAIFKYIYICKKWCCEQRSTLPGKGPFGLFNEPRKFILHIILRQFTLVNASGCSRKLNLFILSPETAVHCNKYLL